MSVDLSWIIITWLVVCLDGRELSTSTQIILVQSNGWPRDWFGLVTGYLESGETVRNAVIREVSALQSRQFRKPTMEYHTRNP